MLGHNVFNDFWRSGRGPHHLPFPQKTMEIILFSMILRVEKVPLSAPTSAENYGNHYVFNDFSGWTRAPVTSTSPKNDENHDFSMLLEIGQGRPSHHHKIYEIAMFSMILKLGRVPPISSRLPKKLWKS